jgi:hypothetical protein
MAVLLEKDNKLVIWNWYNINDGIKIIAHDLDVDRTDDNLPTNIVDNFQKHCMISLIYYLFPVYIKMFDF